MRWRRWQRCLSRENGQVLAIAAVMLTGILAFLGLIIDGGLLYAQRRQAQNAADEAALAAAYALTEGDSMASVTLTATEYASANGFGEDEGEITVNIPPVEGEFAGNSDYVEIVVSQQPTTFFVHAVLPGGAPVEARAVAGIGGSGGGPYVLFANNSSCSTQDQLSISGSNNTIEGAVHSNSQLKIGGSDNGFVGPVTYNCSLQISGQNNTFDPQPVSSSTHPLPVDYQYNDFPCTMTFTQPTDLNSVDEAWVGGDKDSGQLLPGVYCSTKKLTLSGSDVSGNITLVSKDEVNISGSNFDLTPYWNDVLAFSDDTFPKGIDMSGSGGDWLGLMLAPNGLAKVAGSGNLNYAGAIIADQIHMSGSNLSISAVDYGQGGPAIVALVE